MAIDAHINARVDIEQLGVSAMTSMFSCGTHERRMCDTIHPEIHDSDRLAMWRGNGEWIFRPLNNPATLQFNAFADKDPKGFGLVQTDHEFSSYQDTVDWYSRRPSLWVEPTTPWGEGSVNLMEIPTTGETLDNIVAFWTPKTPVTAGTSLHYGYKLYWSALPPVSTPLAQVNATRSGMGGFIEGWAPGATLCGGLRGRWSGALARRHRHRACGDGLGGQGQGFQCAGDPGHQGLSHYLRLVPGQRFGGTGGDAPVHSDG